jgi:CDP-paratose 2-epimerase
MKWLITGGAGFIGCNAASRLARDGHAVVVVDDLSRRGSSMNLAWLKEQHLADFVEVDVRDASRLERLFRAHPDVDVVLHLAAQVAVTTSVTNPRRDFEINALGTFNVCEAVRQVAPHAILLNASTNKVYGGMDDVRVIERDGRYAYADLPHGVSELQPLDFHSPYGCSKGIGDQYVHDYARIYGLRTVTFRQSCIYGPRQFGVEDQGWVAWFTIAAVLGKPITIYGDGKQIRDLLWVDDLVDAYLAAVVNIERAAGSVYNLGGGPGNTLSLLELIAHLAASTGRPITPTFGPIRPGDQPVFVCDVRRAKTDLGWAPKIGVHTGVEQLLAWVQANTALISRILSD